MQKSETEAVKQVRATSNGTVPEMLLSKPSEESPEFDNTSAWTPSLAVEVFRDGGVRIRRTIDHQNIAEIKTTMADLMACYNALFPFEERVKAALEPEDDVDAEARREKARDA